MFLVNRLVTEMIKTTPNSIDDIELLESGGWRVAEPDVISLDVSSSSYRILYLYHIGGSLSRIPIDMKNPHF